MTLLEQMPPEWAIEKALSLSRTGTTIADVKRHWPGHSMALAFAAYIAEHEEEPVDPLYEALFAVVELGRYDTREQTQLLRHELAARGLVIVELGKTEGAAS